MKRTVLTGIAVIAMLGVTKAAIAADYKIGLKVWANTWSETIHPQVGDSQTFDNGSAIMTGPSLSVLVADKWFVNAAYLTTLGAYESTEWIVPEDTMKFRRSDLDLRIGRLFRPPFLFRPDPGVTLGIYLGYKRSDAPASYTNPASDVRNAHVGTWKQKGPGLGFLADIQLNQSTAIYGDLAFFSLDQEFIAFQNVQPQPLHASGTVYEFGVARTITASLSASVGIKGEHSSVTEESGDVDGNDFFGLIAGIAYSF